MHRINVPLLPGWPTVAGLETGLLPLPMSTSDVSDNDSKTKVILPLVSVAIGCCAVAIVVTMGALFYFVKV